MLWVLFSVIFVAEAGFTFKKKQVCYLSHFINIGKKYTFAISAQGIYNLF